MRIIFYVSGHGFGHASRDIEIIRAIATSEPRATFTVRTAVPRWFFERLRVPADVQPFEADTGMSQIDSLRCNEHESARRAARFYGAFEHRVEDEARTIERAGADLVVGDIPPLAFAAARRAGVPSVAIGNFTWDWIYDDYPAFRAEAPEAISVIRRAYAAATRGLRLPFCGGFDPMAAVTTDIPLVARQSRRDPADTRRLLGIDGDRPVVLTSFGAYGAPLPYETAARGRAFALVTIPQHPPHDLLYEDVVAAADVVISKPGYGVVSECIANGAALFYTSRGRFIEYDRFVDEMPRVLRCRYLSQEDLLAGRWADAIEALLAQPQPPERLRLDGADVAAREILRTPR